VMGRAGAEHRALRRSDVEAGRLPLSHISEIGVLLFAIKGSGPK